MTESLEANALRDTRENVGTQFRWWAPGGATEAKMIFTNFELDAKMADLKKDFDATLKVKFLIHGFQAGDAPWALTMKDSLMSKEKCNVIIVDWSKGAAESYPSSVANTRVVGAELGHFLVVLVKDLGVKPEDVHIIGHSLGAHTAGYAGKWVKPKLENPIGRITGLDPAGPEFYNQIAGERLDMTDATFVDVIHTNADSLGLAEAVGHFDFYPNGGGEIQPGCKTKYEVFLSSSTDTMADDLACSHSRAVQLFIDSINSDSCQFFAEQCTSWQDFVDEKCKAEGTLKVEMGYNADKYQQFVEQNVHKSLYLKTNGESSYCMLKKE